MSAQEFTDADLRTDVESPSLTKLLSTLLYAKTELRGCYARIQRVRDGLSGALTFATGYDVASYAERLSADEGAATVYEHAIRVLSFNIDHAGPQAVNTEKVVAELTQDLLAYMKPEEVKTLGERHDVRRAKRNGVLGAASNVINKLVAE